MSDVKGTVLDAFARRQRELVDLCAKLERIPSKNPPGDTTRIAEVVDEYLGKHGIPTKACEPRKRMPNVVGTNALLRTVTVTPLAAAQPGR